MIICKVTVLRRSLSTRSMVILVVEMGMNKGDDLIEVWKHVDIELDHVTEFLCDWS